MAFHYEKAVRHDMHIITVSHPYKDLRAYMNRIAKPQERGFLRSVGIGVMQKWYSTLCRALFAAYWTIASFIRYSSTLCIVLHKRLCVLSNYKGLPVDFHLLYYNLVLLTT